MGRRSAGIGVERHFVDAWLNIVTVAYLVTEALKRLDEALDRAVFRNVRRPVVPVKTAGRPPPHIILAGGPRDTVISRRHRTHDLIVVPV